MFLPYAEFQPDPMYGSQIILKNFSKFCNSKIFDSYKFLDHRHIFFDKFESLNFASASLLITVAELLKFTASVQKVD